MSNFYLKLEAWVEDVNKEDGVTLQFFEKIINKMFLVIKWAFVPYLFYLFVTLLS